MMFPQRIAYEDIAQDMVDQAHASYDQAKNCDFIPVVIPVRNGAETLGATLLALSRSYEPTLPIIVDNNSSDATPDIAARFGVPYLEQHDGSKVAAVQAGLRYAAMTLCKQEVMLTDADALHQPAASAVIRKRLSQSDPRCGLGLLGTSVFSGGSSTVGDVTYTSARFLKDASRAMRGQLMSPRGHNYAIAFDTDGDILASIQELDPSIFIGDAYAVLDAVAQAGGELATIRHPASVVSVRGDRVGSIKDVVTNVFSKAKELESYRQQYGQDFTQYKKQ